MRTLLWALGALFVSLPLGAEVIWSEPRDFYVDPPVGWTFVEDPTPEHFVMTDAGRRIILEIFSQDKGDRGELKAKAADLKSRLKAQGDEETFTWNDRPAWLGDLTFKAGPVEARGWALVADDGDGWVSALAYTPKTEYDQASDVLISTLNSLALGQDGRREPGPLSTFFAGTATRPRTETKAIPGLPTPFSMTYNLDRNEAVQAAMERETRILLAQLGPQVNDQNVMAPGWSRFYRQIYREFYSSLQPLAAYWQGRLAQKSVTQDDLPQTILSWVQAFTYDRKNGLTDLSTPWETLTKAAGDCDSRSLVYLAIMDHLGVPGILMVSAIYSHGIAAIEKDSPGFYFPYENRKWLLAETISQVPLGSIDQKMTDPNKWIPVDLWQKP